MMQTLRDFFGMLLIYALYAAATVYFYGTDHFYFDESTPIWPVIMFSTSLFLTLLWYVLGEWVVRPNAPASSWYTLWFIELFLLLVTAAVVAFMEDAAARVNPSLDSFPWLHFVGGVGAYYLSSVLFSPTFAKFRIWPAKLIRSW